jgi:hypothetical protein
MGVLHLPGCASYSLGLEWTLLPFSSWPEIPLAVRSVSLWCPGEGSRREMIRAWLIEVDFTVCQRNVSGSSVCLWSALHNNQCRFNLLQLASNIPVLPLAVQLLIAP